MINLQPKDYAALAFTAGELQQELSISESFKKLTRSDRFPGCKVNVSLEIIVEDNFSGSEEASFNLTINDGVKIVSSEQTTPVME